MKNIAIANGLNLSSYAYMEIYEGKNTLQLVSEYAATIPDVDKTFLLLPEEGEAAGPDIGGFTVIKQKDWTLKGFLTRIRELSEGCDNIFYFYADCPFLDSELTSRMFQNHRRYFADYTFADGYPYGLSPEIIKPKLLSALLTLLGEKENAMPERSSFFDLIKKDINAFDIETEISPEDLRLLRVSLSPDSKRNFLLLERLIKHGPPDSFTADSICRRLLSNGEILRTLPSFFSIQIVEGCPQLCSYCPYPVFGTNSIGKKDEMPLEKFESILKAIEDMCEDGVINISLWGEPAYHSRIVDVVRAVLDRSALRIIIETSGIGWKKEILYDLAGRAGKAPDWIVSLDTLAPELYGKLRGPGFEEATQTADTLLDCFPGHVYIQAVRMKDNEEDMESFYRYWKKKTDQVIIQKYDHFCGLLPERKVTDLSPLKRFPCWHIKRDVNILIDGRVPICREDAAGKYPLGNVFEDSLEAIWGRGEEYYLRHLRQDYPEICKACDEHYTYYF